MPERVLIAGWEARAALTEGCGNLEDGSGARRAAAAQGAGWKGKESHSC